MPIQAAPIVIPSKTLDKYWVQSLSIGTTGVGGVALLKSTLIPYNSAGDIGPEIILDTINVFEQIAINPETEQPVDADAAQIFSLFMAYIDKKAKEQGKIT